MCRLKRQPDTENVKGRRLDRVDLSFLLPVVIFFVNFAKNHEYY